MIFVYICVLVILLYILIINKYSYWSKRGISGPDPIPVIGNFGNVMLLKQSTDQLITKVYNDFANERVVGLYRGFKPLLVIRDIELIKQVLIKDFDLFQDRGVKTINTRLSDNLFQAEGETWRILRQKLTPTFTSGKLKNMIPLIVKCTEDYITYVEYLIQNNYDQEIRTLTSKYTLQVIGSCAFGIDVEAFSNKENIFITIARKVFTPTMSTLVWQMLEMVIPGIKNKIPLADTTTGLKKFFLSLVNTIINEREGKPLVRRDFMDLMIELKEKGLIRRKTDKNESEIKIDNELIAAQALVFYSAGFETSSATMSFLLYELAINQNIQDNIYKEICQVLDKYNGKLCYESVKEMTYLEMNFEEILRKYTIAGVLLRKSLANYTFPGTNITIETGTPIMIPAHAIHMDPKYYPCPEIFNPMNFSPDNRKKIPQCAYIPFGDGPRNCIGMRFAKVQSMMGTAAFLKEFKVERSSKTQDRLEYNPKAITLTSLHGIWLKISKR